MLILLILMEHLQIYFVSFSLSLYNNITSTMTCCSEHLINAINMVSALDTSSQLLRTQCYIELSRCIYLFNYLFNHIKA